MYNLILKRWQAGKLTAEQVGLFAHVGYITAEQAEQIKAT